MKVLNLLISIIILISCSSERKKEMSTYNPDINFIYKNLLDTFLIDRTPDFTVCGNFYYEFTESSLSTKLHKFTSPELSERDIDIMVKQYNKSKTLNIDKFVDLSNYAIIEKLDDYDTAKFSKYHYALSPPMFTIGKDTCFVYIHAYVNRIGQTGAFTGFTKTDGVWKGTFLIVDKSPLQLDGYHHHDYTYVNLTNYSKFIRELNNRTKK